HANAKRVKCCDCRSATRRRRNQRLHPLAHLTSRFVCKGHRQDGPSWRTISLHQVGNAVSYDPRLAAAGPGEDQERHLRMFNSLTLAGVEAFQEVHGNIDFNMQGVRESDVLRMRSVAAGAANVHFGATFTRLSVVADPRCAGFRERRTTPSI